MASRFLTRAGADVRRVEFVVHPTNRGWTRDSGPVFVRRNVDRNLETAIVHFHFNAWAKYRDWQKDRRVPEAAAKHLGKRLFDARWQGKPFILEGGGIDVNGHGTLLTTEECYLSRKIQVRNLGLGRKEFEAALKDNLGVSNVLWLSGGVTGDDTHGHVDDICRFVNRKTVVLIKEDNRRRHQLPPAGGELGAHPGFPAGGRLPAWGGGTPHADASGLRRGSAAGQLCQLLHFERRRDRPYFQ